MSIAVGMIETLGFPAVVEAVNRVNGGKFLSTHIKSSPLQKLRRRATHSLHRRSRTIPK